jgi:hypothetical protein
MPGFMFYLEPHGDRVIGLGIDRTDTAGSLNVSLFDVSDADAPRMLARVPFATPGITEDYEILNSEVSEDQDRIQKSFRTFDDGLVVVPFSALRPYDAQDAGCANTGGGVQLVDWQGDTLTKHALLPVPGNPRRAFELGDAMIAVSDSNVRSFAMSNLDVAHQSADLTIGACAPPDDYGYGVPVDGAYGEGERPPLACSLATGDGADRQWPVTFVLGTLGLLLARRRGVRSRSRPTRSS